MGPPQTCQLNKSLADIVDLTTVRFARPNIQIYDAHVVDLYQRVCARYLVGVKGAETKAKHSYARLSTEFQNGSRSLSKPCPAQNNPEVNHRKTRIDLIFQYDGGESVSQSLLKDKAFSTFVDQNLPFELRPEMGIPPPIEGCSWARAGELKRRPPVLDPLARWSGRHGWERLVCAPSARAHR